LEDVVAFERRPHAQVAEIATMVWRVLSTPLELGGHTVPGLAWLEEYQREVPFAFPLIDAERRVSYVRGKIDLVFDYGGLVYWLDWKSDSLATPTLANLTAHIREHYREQAVLYTAAISRAYAAHDLASYQARIGGHLYCFLRPNAWVTDRLAFDQLADELARLATVPHQGGAS
jgi:ATP-dependent exoDNAse (exonuclease V) beta subunit